MKQLFTLIVIIAFALPSFAQDNSQQSTNTTYYFIRHAEKDRSDKTNRDPELTEAGKKRALKWSEIFQHVSFDAVYSTDYNRTKQTAQPTADSKKLVVLMYDPRILFSEDFSEATVGKTVLIVGHSNTTPAFVNTVLGMKKYEDIDDNNNGNLYIVTISEGGEKIDQVLTIN